jgi:hypothetical protein
VRNCVFCNLWMRNFENENETKRAKHQKPKTCDFLMLAKVKLKFALSLTLTLSSWLGLVYGARTKLGAHQKISSLAFDGDINLIM